MTSKVPNFAERRRLLAGLGAAAIGGTAAGLGGSAARAESRAGKTDTAVPSVCVFDVNETLLDIELHRAVVPTIIW